MDLAKLEKMKVVELRNELQTRGLDTKGVKALLIERLRAHFEGGAIPSGDDGVSETTQGTPSRRQRRTRSMSRSPSPIVTAPIAAEPDLETLQEEEQPADIVPESHDELNSPVIQESVELVDSNIPAIVEPDSEYDKDIPIEEQVENSGDESHNSLEMVEQEAQVVNEEDGNPVDVNEDAVVHSANGNSLQMEVDEESSTHKVEKQDNDADASIEQDQDKQDILEKSIEHHRTGERRKRSHSHTRSPSGSRSPKRRGGDKRDSKAGAEDRTVPEDEPSIPDNQLGLSWLDSDLHLRIDMTDFASAKPLSPEIYSLMWAGARANYGVCNGKVCFEVRLVEEMVPDNIHHFRDEPYVRGFRVGFSTSQTSLLLGEAEHSYGYCESGRKAHNNDFVDYGKPYQLDDVIGCYLDLESTPCTIKYTLNGDDMGMAFEFDKSILGDAGALFPHIVTKGYEYTVNFTDSEQLLVNAERPTRKRRKQRKDSQREEDNDGEKWKVLDEAMADEDEIEKKDDETKPTDDGDQFEVASESASAVDKEDEISVNDQEANVTNPTVNKSISEETDVAQEIPSEAEIDTSCGGNEDIANGDSVDSKKTEDIVADEPGQQTPTNELSHPDCASQPDSPSQNKRSKTDTKTASPNQAEDEYEDVVPTPRDNVTLLKGYILLAKIPSDQLIAGPQRAASRKDCEVILMVGLPGAGKTHWTQKYIADHVDKRFEVIGPDAMIAKMTIDGNSRKSFHKGRWDKVYEICLNSLGGLEDIAMKRRRNFILDQTNAYASVQRRKMKGFSDFKRIAVVCIPNEDELKRRITEKEEKGNAFTVKESTINNLRANFTLPSLEFGWFDDIIFTDLTGDDAKAEVKKYNEKGKKAIDADRTREKRSRGGRDQYRRDERNRNRYGDDRRRDYGGQRHDSRWNDSRRGGGGYSSGSGGGGNRGYDNRNRGYGGSSSGQQTWMQNNRQRGYDERGYGGVGGGGGGGGARGYDNRNRGYGGGGGGQQNWMQNNRQRGYDERVYGSGSSRDYRDRDRGNDRNRVGNNDRNRGSGGGSSQSNYRSGGSSHQQRDFRPGHRDTKEDSRGGYERSAAQLVAKYGNNSASMGAGGGAYEQYKQQSTAGSHSAKTSVTGKWSTYAQHQQQTQQQHQQAGVWQQQQPMQQQYPQSTQQSTGQQYWGYNQMQGYANQPGWQGADQQQQQWMSWWQQQQTGSGATGVANAGGSTNAPAASNDGGATNHYWSQYAYTTQQATADSEKK